MRPDIALDVAMELMFGAIFHRWMLRMAPLSPEYADDLANAVVAALVVGG